MRTDNSNKLIEATFAFLRLIKEKLQYTSQLTHLSMVQLQALVLIDTKTNISMREIAQHFRIELPSATSLLNKLHAMKLVERHADSNDRRIVRIKLTTKGKSLLKDAMIERGKKIEELLSVLSEKDKKEFFRILMTLTEKNGGTK